MMSRSSYRELLAAPTQDATLAPGSPPPTAAAQYTAAGQLQSLTYGNGVATTWGYDPVTARLSSISTPGVLDLSYTYYPNGNVHTFTDDGQTTT